MSRPLPLAAYGVATAALEPLASGLLRRRARQGKEDPARLGERLGRASLPRPPGPLAWLHGASVGEGLSLLPLVEGLAARRPDLTLLVTTGTVASAELLARRLPEAGQGRVVHQYAPVDAPGVARRFLDHWRPELAVLAESELWPNLILAAKDRGVPLALLSARLSEASLRGWARAPASARALLSAFSLVMAQDEATAVQLAALGARDDGRLNLKLAGAPLPADPARLEAYRRAAKGRPVLLAASTHAGEDAGVLDAFAPLAERPERPHLVIAPRHPVRGTEVAALAAARGLVVDRQGAGQPFDGEAVHVADVLGELGVWFRLASACFIGGGWAPGVGGHNPLEPARLGCPATSGPGVENWRGVYDGLAASGAVSFVDRPEALTAFWARALAAEPAVAAQAAAARSFAQAQSGRLDSALDRLERLLP